MSTISHDLSIDATGLPDPLPVLHAFRELKKMRSGQVLKVSARGGQTAIDFHDFSRLTGNPLQTHAGEGDQKVYLLQKR